MILTSENLRIIKGVIGVIEVSTPTGGYDNITLLPDGPGDRVQVTFGRFQTTEYGHLKELVRRYIAAPGELFDGPLSKYLPKIGKEPLAGDKQFHSILRQAARVDPQMAIIQDKFFDEVYFAPARAYAEKLGLRSPLAALVVFDSFIHGGIEIVRKLFPELPPSKGGTEKVWITAYVKARHEWLRTHKRKALHATIYRTRCFLEQIAANNWDLIKLPIAINGMLVR